MKTGLKDHMFVWRETKKLPLKVLSYSLLYVSAVVFLFPLYWMITGSFKAQDVAMTIPPEWLPLHPSLINYGSLFHYTAARWMFNSFAVSLGTMLLVCIISTMAGYALAKKRFPGRDLIFWIFIGSMTLPLAGDLGPSLYVDQIFEMG